MVLTDTTYRELPRLRIRNRVRVLRPTHSQGDYAHAFTPVDCDRDHIGSRSGPGFSPSERARQAVRTTSRPSKGCAFTIVHPGALPDHHRAEGTAEEGLPLRPYRALHQRHPVPDRQLPGV